MRISSVSSLSMAMKYGRILFFLCVCLIECRAQHQVGRLKKFSTESSKSLFPTQSGPIVDVSCDVEQLEEANDSQLFTILHDLKNTEFFRNFAVDLDQRCPLENFGKPSKKQSSSSSSSGRSSLPIKKTEETSFSFQSSYGDNNNNNHEDENGDGQCASEGIPDFEPEAGPACGVAEDDNQMFPFGTSKSSSSSAFSSSFPKDDDDTSSSFSNHNHDKLGKHVKKDPTQQQQNLIDETKKNGEEEEYDCTGIEGEESDPELDPPCALNEEDFQTYTFHPDSSTPIRDLLSSALHSIQTSILRSMGWESESQRRTFSWSRPSDPVIVSDEEPCNNDDVDHKDSPSGGLLPETFWMDICSNIKIGDGMKYVNLALNPERNTGYNGTHIWRAIYEENCIALDGSKSEPMCYEERVLYRLISGLHASTTLSIAMNNKPPNKRKGREHWEPNPEYFMKKFENNPEYIRNLHFSYVVLLRALKKAYPVLHSYEVKTGNIVDDETAQILLKRLLDSSILSSCSGAFTAFDESLMFREKISHVDEGQLSLQENFKGVFHNVSSILDCVQCQQCKLHGKMAMLGYGTALKILFLPRNELIMSSLSRNEIVAFINTIAKFSESLKHVRELTSLYWAEHHSSNNNNYDDAPSSATQLSDVSTDDPLDSAMRIIAALGKEGKITEERETQLVTLALQHDKDLLILAKYYANDANKFLQHSSLLGLNIESGQSAQPDAIIIGSGLAGLSATLNILDRGGKVLLIEKEHYLGGNSNKASSGINACCPNNATTDDYLEKFRQDTIKSAGSSSQPHLIDVLVSKSADAVSWLKERVGVDLSLLAQLGGHQSKRTHRPKNGMAGAEIMFGLQREVKKYQKSGMVEILVDTRVSKLLKNEEGHVTGVSVNYIDEDDSSERPSEFNAAVVMLATGGFASDRSSESYLATYRPELLKMPATAGAFSTGDGITLAHDLGAGLIDMDKVQVHPTGWIDPKDPMNPTKILAAELMRGVGGVLINSSGQRFCNELGTRAYVTDKMLSHDEYYAANKKWNQENDNLSFSLVLSSSAALDGKKHIDHYTHKGLLFRLNGISELSEWMGVEEAVLIETMRQYQKDSELGVDKWGKTSFRGVPQLDLFNETFYAGSVTPVLHYCMGGITIDKEGHVTDSDGNRIPGLYAAGEVSGGVHGDNRLGGNSLLECTVFGSIVGQNVPIKERLKVSDIQSKVQTSKAEVASRSVTMDELKLHNTPEDCWVAIHGTVYDLTEFADEHPAGAESITILAGKDGTEAFEAIHNKNLLDDFDEEIIGKLV